MECPFCTDNNSRVLESRSTEDGKSIRRRRECSSCAKRFTTYERMEHAPIVIIKSSGSREVYSRDKLVASIIRSCSKSQITTLTVDTIVSKVESYMYKEYSREIPASALGEIVMRFLKESDPIAYIRYASIFKKFNSVNSFIEEIQSIEDQVLGLSFEEIPVAEVKESACIQ